MRTWIYTLICILWGISAYATHIGGWKLLHQEIEKRMHGTPSMAIEQFLQDMSYDQLQPYLLAEDEHGQTPFERAVRCNLMDVAYLLRHAVDAVDIYGRTRLIRVLDATSEDIEQTCVHLLRSGGSITCCGARGSALYSVVQKGAHHLTHTLLTYHIPLSTDENNQLHHEVHQVARYHVSYCASLLSHIFPRIHSSLRMSICLYAAQKMHKEAFMACYHACGAFLIYVIRNQNSDLFFHLVTYRKDSFLQELLNIIPAAEKRRLRDISPRKKSLFRQKSTTIIHHAIEKRNSEALYMLLAEFWRHGVDAANVQDDDGLTPIFYIAFSAPEAEHLLNILCAYGGRIDVAKKANKSAHSEGAQETFIERLFQHVFYVIKLQHGGDAYQSPLYNKRLIAHVLEVCSHNYHTCTLHDAFEAYRMIWENNQNRPCFLSPYNVDCIPCIERKHCVRLFAQYGLNIYRLLPYMRYIREATYTDNDDDWSVLSVIIHGNVPCLDTCQDRITDQDGMTPLMWAVVRNNIDAAYHLMEHCVGDINQQDTYGNTAFMWACRRNLYQLTLDLLRYGAQPTIANYMHEEPIIHVVSTGKEAAFQAAYEHWQVGRIMARPLALSRMVSAAGENGHIYILEKLMYIVYELKHKSRFINPSGG